MSALTLTNSVTWRRVALAFAAMAIGVTAAPRTGLGSTVAGWTFETTQPAGTAATIGPFAAEVGSGAATGHHAAAGTVWSSPAGNGSAHSFSSNTWATGDYLQFQVSTSGLDHVLVSWDQTSSNTGPRDFQFAYSTDGSSFTNVGSIYSIVANASPNPVWNATTSSALYTMSLDLSGVSAINNVAAVYFRLSMADAISANGGTVATAGTDRVDNFTVMASAVPEPTSAALAGCAVVALGLVVRRRRLRSHS